MKITKIVRFEETKPEELEPLHQLMAVFCSALRFSFNRLVEGEKEKELVKKVQVLFPLNKRYAEDAIMQAKAVLSSQNFKRTKMWFSHQKGQSSVYVGDWPMEICEDVWAICA